MKTRVNFGDKLSKQFTVENGVKQKDLDAYNIFAINFAVVLSRGFQTWVESIFIKYQTIWEILTNEDEIQDFRQKSFLLYSSEKSYTLINAILLVILKQIFYLFCLYWTQLMMILAGSTTWNCHL